MVNAPPKIKTTFGVFEANGVLLLMAGTTIITMPKKTPTTAPRLKTKWKCATTKYVSWRLESIQRLAKNRPVKPPDTNSTIRVLSRAWGTSVARDFWFLFLKNQLGFVFNFIFVFVFIFFLKIFFCPDFFFGQDFVFNFLDPNF